MCRCNAPHCMPLPCPPVPLAVGPVATSLPPAPPSLQLRSQPPLPLCLVSFASRPPIPLRLLPRSPSFAEISCAAPLLVHVLGIYGIRSRLRDTVPSPPLRFAATSQIRFVPSSDYFSAVPHSTDRPSFFFLSLSLFLCER